MPSIILAIYPNLRGIELPAFIPGQRWISETEPELGLGLVLSLEGNRVTILFVAAGERRTYAADNAPLTRVRFVPGDTIDTQDGLRLEVKETVDQAGLLTYHSVDSGGNPVLVEEMDLDHALQFNKPQERLFTGQLDSDELFGLRHETMRHLARLEPSEIRGFLGSRTTLIPHQIYIAHEVALRESPRVLLADEVGLGKTIEAGMIIHHQLLTGRSDRVLIIVPEPLLHQWLVEMRRRFNLKFSLFDQERFGECGEDNPFSLEQLVLVSLEFLMIHPDRQEAALSANWDLVVIDEAHHLGWNAHSVSQEYSFTERLSQNTPGLLLLTATPEQLGKEGHFARLRLLDPNRFHSYESFLREESEYSELASTLKHLIDEERPDPSILNRLKDLLSNDLADDVLDCLVENQDKKAREAAREEIVQLLLDRHGTGRVLFRNTRATIKGFPKRALEPARLEMPEPFLNLCQQSQLSLEAKFHPEHLFKEEAGPPWWQKDPRVSWLIRKIKQLRPAKILVICSLRGTAEDLEEALRNSGIPTALFHEGLGILARDRAAAWFSEEEDGAQVLVCSEIGSEGRNFQFAHHLVLFDLPLNADLLEQRIGRLDRIGQTETIKLHVPYFADTPQEILFHWYQRGLDAFETLNPAAQSVHEELRNELIPALSMRPDSQMVEEVLEKARAFSEKTLKKLNEGRDRLLELNSCRTARAKSLAEQYIHEDSDPLLWPYLERVFDAYGVNVEEHSRDCMILKPGEHMRMQFPELPDDGVTVTLDRATALAREDLLFLTWEHPMVRGAMDIILNNEHGNACLSILHHPDLDPGQLLIECYHVVECSAPRRLHAGRFFPPRLIRTLIDQDGQDLSRLSEDEFKSIHRHYDRDHSIELLRSQRRRIEPVSYTHLLPSIAADGIKRMLDAMTRELKRLAALRKVNPLVRAEELDQMKENALELHASIQASRQRLDSVRIIISA